MNADAIRIEIDSDELHSFTAVGTIPGVAITFVAGLNGAGIGTLLCNGDGTSLAWRAPGSNTFGQEVACSSDGEYVLCDGDDPDKWIRVSVAIAYVVGGSQAEVYLRERTNELAGPDVAASEAAQGSVRQCVLSLRNVDSLHVSDVTIWCGADDRTSISVDGITWESPIDEANGLVISMIAPGEAATLYVRREISAGTTASAASRVNLHFAFDSYPTAQ